MCWTRADHLQLQLIWGAVCRILCHSGLDLTKNQDCFRRLQWVILKMIWWLVPELGVCLPRHYLCSLCSWWDSVCSIIFSLYKKSRPDLQMSLTSVTSVNFNSESSTHPAVPILMTWKSHSVLAIKSQLCRLFLSTCIQWATSRNSCKHGGILLCSTCVLLLCRKK